MALELFSLVPLIPSPLSSALQIRTAGSVGSVADDSSGAFDKSGSLRA